MTCLQVDFGEDEKSAELIRNLKEFDPVEYAPYDRLVLSAKLGARTYTLELDVNQPILNRPSGSERLNFSFFFAQDSLDSERYHLTNWIGESSISLCLSVILARDWMSFDYTEEEINSKYSGFNRRC